VRTGSPHRTDPGERAAAERGVADAGPEAPIRVDDRKERLAVRLAVVGHEAAAPLEMPFAPEEDVRDVLSVVLASRVPGFSIC
jgi:hypothetical protein